MNLSVNAQPGLLSSFPWAAPIVNSFEEYKIVKLIYHYRNAVSTATDGTVLMMFDYDALDDPPVTAVALTQSSNYVDTVPWKATRLVVPGMGKWLYTRDKLIPNADLKTYDLGRIHICTEGTPVKILGYIEVEYTIELRKRQSSALFTPSLSFGLQATFNVSPGNFGEVNPEILIGAGETLGSFMPLASGSDSIPAIEGFNSLPNQLVFVKDNPGNYKFPYGNALMLPAGVYQFTYCVTINGGVIGDVNRMFCTISGPGGPYINATVGRPAKSFGNVIGTFTTYTWNITRRVYPTEIGPGGVKVPQGWGAFSMFMEDTGGGGRSIAIHYGTFTALRLPDPISGVNAEVIVVEDVLVEEEKIPAIQYPQQPRARGAQRLGQTPSEVRLEGFETVQTPQECKGCGSQ